MNKPTLSISRCLSVGVMAFATVSMTARAADLPRQAEVAARGADVMPFNLKATTHIFTQTDQGGIQRVVAKDVRDLLQTRLVREHLHDIQQQFQKGDFSGPAHIHGADMPGLAELKMARPDAISVVYSEVEAGAELRYRTSDARLVAALHRWFDGQLSDHGADAMRGHQHKHSDMPKQ
jgi:hypothetical protein